MGSLGFPELIIILVVALIVFGPKKLPDLGAGLGKAIRDFKGALNSTDDDDEKPASRKVDAPRVSADPDKIVKK